MPRTASALSVPASEELPGFFASAIATEALEEVTSLPAESTTSTVTGGPDGLKLTPLM